MFLFTLEVFLVSFLYSYPMRNSSFLLTRLGVTDPLIAAIDFVTFHCKKWSGATFLLTLPAFFHPRPLLVTQLVFANLHFEYYEIPISYCSKKKKFHRRSSPSHQSYRYFPTIILLVSCKLGIFALQSHFLEQQITFSLIERDIVTF